MIVAKRLEEGLFSRINPRYKREVILTQGEFSLFFEGANLEKRFIESPVEIKKVTNKLKALYKVIPFGGQYAMNISIYRGRLSRKSI